MLNLKTLCVEKIVDNIPRNNIAFITSVDAVLKFYIEYLRRVYSHEILEMLQGKRSWKTEYVDFLINRHLRILDTRWLENISSESVIKIIEMGPALKRLTLHGNFDFVDWGKVICRTPNLETVSYQDYCDKFIYCIATFSPIIESVEITGSTGVSDQGIEHCFWNKSSEVPFSMLKEISIDSNIGNDGVKSLIQNLTCFERVEYQQLGEFLHSLYKCDLFKSIDKVSSCSLTHLNLTGAHSSAMYGDILKTSISVCRYLKSFACYVHNNEELEMCYQLPELEQLELFNVLEKDERQKFVCCTYIDEFLKLKGKMLISLHLTHFLVSASVMARYCPRLCSLHLIKVCVNFKEDDTPSFQNLKKIYIDSIETTDEVICLMSSSPKLEHLHFENCRWFFWMFPSPTKRARISKYFKECKLIKLCFINCHMLDLIVMENIILTCSSLAYLDITRSLLDVYDEDHREVAIYFDRLCSLKNVPVFKYSENAVSEFRAQFSK